MYGMQVTLNRAQMIPCMLVHCSALQAVTSVLLHLIHTVLDSGYYSAFPQGGVNWSSQASAISFLSFDTSKVVRGIHLLCSVYERAMLLLLLLLLDVVSTEGHGRSMRLICLSSCISSRCEGLLRNARMVLGVCAPARAEL